MEVQKFESSEGNVWKYVFEFDDAIAEAVLYRYGSFAKRTVMCVSVQSGCPVGCGFCGTGKRFIRNLTSIEISYQVNYLIHEATRIEDISGLLDMKCKKLQIMFMSMGEPMLNFDEVFSSCRSLNRLYPNAQLLISTVGINSDIVLGELLHLSKMIEKVGLQFSIHQAFDKKRDCLIPYKNKMTLREIRDYGILWNSQTNRPVYLNYCIDEENSSIEEMERLKDLFSSHIFHFTFSVICSTNETMKEAANRNLNLINHVSNRFLEEGYNVRVFNPAGQDDIGGGCGQLWYVQQYLKDKK